MENKHEFIIIPYHNPTMNTIINSDSIHPIYPIPTLYSIGYGIQPQILSVVLSKVKLTVRINVAGLVLFTVAARILNVHV